MKVDGITSANFPAPGNLPLFLTPQWLDAVSIEGKWDVITEKKNGETVAVFPYFYKKKAGFRIITMPKLTPYLGIWTVYPEHQKYASKLSYEKKIINKLIAKLPKTDLFIQNFHPSFTNWLPFHWKNYKQTTRYTYIIKNLSDLNLIYGNFRENIRREIKKAEKELKVVSSEDLHELYDLNSKMYKEKQMAVPFSLEHLQRVEKLCKEKNCRKLFFAVDENSKVHAALYLVWDPMSSYYLIGATHPEFKTSGAMSLLMWHAIQHSAKVTRQFNFEGSMIEPVERFFRAFGAEQVPYFQIRRTNSFLLKLRDCWIKIRS